MILFLNSQYNLLINVPTVHHINLAIDGWNVFISGLPEECPEEDVMDALLDFGRINAIRIPMDHRSGAVKGYALVEFESFEGAKEAISSLNGKSFLGSDKVVLDFAFRTTTRVSDHGRRK